MGPLLSTRPVFPRANTDGNYTAASQDASPEAESVSFLHLGEGDVKPKVEPDEIWRAVPAQTRRRTWISSPIWMFTTLALLAMVIIQNSLRLASVGYSSGFSTDLADLKPAIKMHQTRFAGAIRDRADGSMHVPVPAVDKYGRRFSGPPTEEVDAAWEELIFGRYVNFRDEEVKWMNRDSGVPDLTFTNMTIPKQLVPGIYGGPDMLHSLHCVNGLRKHLDMAYYEGEPGIPKEYQKMHIYHCIEQLRQAVLCHGDMTPVTLKPVTDETGEVWALLGETERLHTCRDGVALAEAWKKRGKVTGYLAAP